MTRSRKSAASTLGGSGKAARALPALRQTFRSPPVNRPVPLEDRLSAVIEAIDNGLVCIASPGGKVVTEEVLGLLEEARQILNNWFHPLKRIELSRFVYSPNPETEDKAAAEAAVELVSRELAGEKPDALLWDYLTRK